LEPVQVIELGVSVHYAQILSIPIKNHISRSNKTYERQINEENIQAFLYLLQQEHGKRFIEVDVNKKFDKFLHNFLYYYDMAFPLRLTNKGGGGEKKTDYSRDQKLKYEDAVTRETKERN
jgi:hypothetical protein